MDARNRFSKKISIVCKILLGTFMGWTLLLGVTYALSAFFESIEEEPTADGFTIASFDVRLEVSSDNVAKVTQSITVDFSSDKKHGIYVFIPEWLEYTGRDGKVIKRKSLVSGLRSPSDEYVSDVVDEKPRIRLGSAYRYVEKGLKTYVIEYDYDMGEDPFSGFDQFIYHAYGDFWGTEIKNASLEVVMPKSIEGMKVSFFADKYKGEDVSSLVDYSVSGNRLTAAYNDERAAAKGKPLKRALTVDIELPEGFFEGGSFNYGWTSFTVCILIIFLTLLVTFWWSKYGKDHTKVPETVEFYPPEGMDPAAVGYIYNGRYSKKYEAAMLVSLAGKGYITIDEMKDEKDFIITKSGVHYNDLNRAISRLERQLKGAVKREVVLERMAVNPEALTPKAAQLVKYLFKSQDTRTISSASILKQYDKVAEELVGKGAVRVLSDNAGELSLIEKNRRVEIDLLIEEKARRERLAKEQDAAKKPMTEFEKMLLDKLFAGGETVLLSTHAGLYRVFTDMKYYLDTYVKDTIDDKEGRRRLVYALLITAYSVIMSFCNYYFIADMWPKLSPLYFVCFGCLSVSLIFTVFMKRRTVYGQRMKSQIKSFRNFLESAEKERLERLVEADPSYFYTVLPYAYVLGVTKKWIGKFDGVMIPENYMGSFDFSSGASFSGIWRSVYVPPLELEAKSSGSKSGGSSSCGGGCSSGGGGCSSCGGGGSW